MEFSSQLFSHTFVNTAVKTAWLFLGDEVKKRCLGLWARFRPPGDDSQAARMPRIKRVCSAPQILEFDVALHTCRKTRIWGSQLPRF